jgi:hypothetical protein
LAAGATIVVVVVMITGDTTAGFLATGGRAVPCTGRVSTGLPAPTVGFAPDVVTFGLTVAPGEVTIRGALKTGAGAGARNTGAGGA